MGLFDKIKDTAVQAKDAAINLAEEKQLGEKLSNAGESVKKSIGGATAGLKAVNAEAKELKKPLEGAIARYEFSYIGGLEDIPKAKSGAWGMNIMPDKFAFRVTGTTKDWLYDLDIPYADITDIRIEKRTISTAEMFLGAGNDANQQQENVVVLEYGDAQGRKATLRVEMLTGVTIYNQAAKCKELMDLLRRNNILETIKANGQPAQQTGGTDVLGQIEKLAKQKDAGVLSEDEFNLKKAELLAKL